VGIYRFFLGFFYGFNQGFIMINQCLTLLIKMQGFGRFKQMETLYFAGFAMVIFQTWFWRFWWFFLAL